MLTTTIARILFIFVHIASSLLSMTSLKTWFLVCRIIIKDILFYAPMMPFFTRHLLSYFFKSEGRLPVRSTRNIPYADGSCHRQRLNVYAPKMGSDSSSSGGGNKNLPVLLFVHGGTWTSGNKFQYHRLGMTLSEMGMVAVVMNYRVYPRYGRIAEQIEDVELVVRWIIDNIERFGGNLQNVHLMGHSAGAHLISMWALRRHRYWRAACEQGIESNRELKLGKWRPQSMMEFCGIYDIVQHYEIETERKVQDLSPMKPNMGGICHFPEYSPVYAMFETGKDIPPLRSRLPPRVHIFASSNDRTLRNEKQSKRYAQELSALLQREAAQLEAGSGVFSTTTANNNNSNSTSEETSCTPQVTFDVLNGFSHSDPVMCLMGLEKYCTSRDGLTQRECMLQIIRDVVIHGQYTPYTIGRLMSTCTLNSKTEGE